MTREPALSSGVEAGTTHAGCRSSDRGGGSASGQPVPGERAELAARPAAPGDTGQRASVFAHGLPPPADLVRPRRLAWADLMRRVFALDVLECPGCGGRMRILAAIHPPETAQAILECLGLPERAPPIAPARAEEEDFEPGSASVDAPGDAFDG